MSILIVNNSQSPIFSDDKPDREFNDDITLKFIFDLEAKTATDDATNATDSLVFDNKPNQKLNDDDNNLEKEYSQFAHSVDAYYMDASSKLQHRTYQKDYRANNCTVLPTKIYNPHPDNCTLKFLGLVPPPEHPQ